MKKWWFEEVGPKILRILLWSQGATKSEEQREGWRMECGSSVSRFFPSEWSWLNGCKTVLPGQSAHKCRKAMDPDREKLEVGFSVATLFHRILYSRLHTKAVDLWLDYRGCFQTMRDRGKDSLWRCWSVWDIPSVFWGQMSKRSSVWATAGTVRVGGSTAGLNLFGRPWREGVNLEVIESVDESVREDLEGYWWTFDGKRRWFGREWQAVFFSESAVPVSWVVVN